MAVLLKTVGVIFFSVEELSPRPKRSRWSNPAIFAVELAASQPLILLEPALLTLSGIENPDPLLATVTKLLVELPRRMSRLDRKSSTMAVDGFLDLVEASEVDALVGNAAAEVRVEVVDDVELLVEPSMRFPSPVAKPSGRLWVEDVIEVVEEALVDILGDDSTVHFSIIMVFDVVYAAVELSLGMFLLLGLSVFVAIAVEALGSLLMFGLSMARCKILGLLWSTEMVTPTYSLPF